MHAAAPYDNFDFRASFVEKGGRLKRALAATDHDYTFIGKARQILAFRSMRGECRRNLVKRSRAHSEGRDTASNDHTRSG
jgi:hypothetical protein